MENQTGLIFHRKEKVQRLYFKAGIAVKGRIFEQTLSDYFSLTFIYTNDTILRLAQGEIVQ